MAEKKASKEHKVRGHSSITQSHFSLPQFERVSLEEISARLNGGFPTNVVNARCPRFYDGPVAFSSVSVAATFVESHPLL